MKKISLLILTLGLFMFANTQTKLIAIQKGGNYQLLITKIGFSQIFENDVAPSLGTSSGFNYHLTDIYIDHDIPSDANSIAYLVIKASSGNDLVTIGLNLQKQITSSGTRLYLQHLAGRGIDDDGGWKCKSTGQTCGGCIRVKQGGRVVKCDCVNNSALQCEFETSGGGGSNWPAWITALIIAVLGML